MSEKSEKENSNPSIGMYSQNSPPSGVRPPPPKSQNAPAPSKPAANAPASDASQNGSGDPAAPNGSPAP